ncbi:MAG: TatD family hydrolase, partial [Mixta sp.]
PDMPLNGFQGEPNRPERVANVWRTLCELREEPPEEIAATIAATSERLFQLR